MSALAGLVDKGLMARDWAEALAPVDEDISSMGRFLREEISEDADWAEVVDQLNVMLRA